MLTLVNESTGEIHRRCNTCFRYLSYALFCKHDTSPDGLSYYCRDCKSEQYKRRYTPHPRVKLTSAQLKHNAWQRDLMREYGISHEQYQCLVVKSGGVCGICQEPFNDKPTHAMHIDHCHETGRVRGLLCARCNRGLGLFRDNPRFLRNAAGYVEAANTNSSE